MKKLPSVQDLPLTQKKVLLRVDYDVPLKEGQIVDTSRIDESLPTINYLLEQKAQVILLSHLGRPEGKVIPELSLKPVAEYLTKILKRDVNLVSDLNEKTNQELVLLENLRFWPEEESNDPLFAKSLANLGDFFINDAFACSHRQHASIIGLPQILSSAFGFDFLKEVEVLGQIQEQPKRPVVIILGGAKADKLKIIPEILDWADWILVGGKLPLLVSSFLLPTNDKIIMAELNSEGKDITLESVNKFQEVIQKAGTVIWAGPMGLYEEDSWAKGTQEIAKALSQSQTYKVIGGGDTEAALTKFDLLEKIDFISSGGGAMFTFLAQGTLPGIEAIINKK